MLTFIPILSVLLLRRHGYSLSWLPTANSAPFTPLILALPEVPEHDKSSGEGGKTGVQVPRIVLGFRLLFRCAGVGFLVAIGTVLFLLLLDSSWLDVVYLFLPLSAEL